MSARISPFAVLTSAVVLTACFGKVAVVPAAQAPKPPAGAGWQCFEAIAPVRYSKPPRSKHIVHCKREADSCTRTADNYRKDPSFEGVTTCAPRESAYCSATFTNETDASWDCFATLDDCQAQVGGMGGVPGTKQSECSEYK
jgi:hypothetical protein